MVVFDFRKELELKYENCARLLQSSEAKKDSNSSSDDLRTRFYCLYIFGHTIKNNYRLHGR